MTSSASEHRRSLSPLAPEPVEGLGRRPSQALPLAAFSVQWEPTRSSLRCTRGRSSGCWSSFARRTLDVTIAADLAAETFAIAFRSWARLQGRNDAEVRAWLFTVARRQVSRYLRSARAEQRAVRRLGIQVPVVHEDEIDLDRGARGAGLTCVPR